ncbi:MAG: MgtC/SapB family protein, partial [Ramlibacter sp.]
MFAPEALLSGSSAAVALAGALGCGLLIGIERERRKGSGPGRALAGVRSFALASVSGAACMVLGGQWLTLVGAAFIAGLGVVAYARDRSGDPGVTTEIALLLTYVIGALCTADLALAAALAVAVTIVLAARERIHRFASQWLRATEVRDGLLLFALALIAVPLLPDRPLWGPVLNPRTIATLLVLLLAIQAMAHLAQRLLQARHALMWSSLAAGFVSSTATIATLGAQVRERRSSPWVMAGAALLSCVPTLVQLLAVAAPVQPAWLEVLWL